MMKKALLFGLSLSLALSITACGGSNDNTSNSTPNASTPAVTEPADTSTPESEKETNFEEPPVPVIYDIANDPNKDGAISKEEWDNWVANHPEDKNQNMDLSDDVVIETPTPEPTPNTGSTTSSGGGSTSSGGGTTSSGGSTSSGGGSTSSSGGGTTSSGGGTTTTPSTPSTPDADPGSGMTPGSTDISDEDMEAIKNMVEDAGGTWDPATDEELQEAAEEIGGTYNPDTGAMTPNEGSNWVI